MDDGTEDKFLLRQCIIITYLRRMFLAEAFQEQPDSFTWPTLVQPVGQETPDHGPISHMQMLHTLNRFDIALSRLA